MDNVPDELLAFILGFVHGRSLSHMTKCLRVCRRWRNLAIPILYQNLVLHDKRLQSFLSRVTTASSSFAQSVTLGVIPRLMGLLTYPCGWLRCREIMQAFEEVPVVLHGMSKLTSLSIRIFCGVFSEGFSLSGKTLVSLVNLLPEGVVDLDIDTQGYDYNAPGSEHFCTGLQAILPRLRNLRLLLAFLCCRIFGDILAANGEMDAEEASRQPIMFPNLRSAVFYSGNVTKYEYGPEFHESYTLLCGTNGKHFRMDQANDCRDALAGCLRRLWKQGAFPALQNLSIMHSQAPHDVDDQRAFASFTRWDIIENSSTTFPILIRDNYLMTRLLDGSEVIGSAGEVTDIIEGRPGAQISTGSRLPAETIALKAARGIKYEVCPLPRLERSACISFAWDKLLIWEWERLSGDVLLRAVQRDGLVDPAPMKVDVPVGWRIQPSQPWQLSRES